MRTNAPLLLSAAHWIYSRLFFFLFFPFYLPFGSFSLFWEGEGGGKEEFCVKKVFLLQIDLQMFFVVSIMFLST